MVDMKTAGRVQGPGLNLTPQIQPGPVVAGVMVAPVNQAGAGSNLVNIASSLASMGASVSKFGAVYNEKQIETQTAQSDVYVAQIQAGFGTQATQADINDVTSRLHPKVRQRVTEDYMFATGTTWAQGQLENMPYEATLSPEAEQAFYAKVRADGLQQAGSDPLKAAGFMKAIQGQINQRGQQVGAQRTAEWQTIQENAFSGSLLTAADGVSSVALLPALSDAVTQVATERNAPWLVAFLTRSAQIESSGGRDLDSSLSSAQGPFQFTKGTGEAYGLMTVEDRNDPYKSANAAAEYAMNSFTIMKSKLGRDPTMAELYLAHQQGAGGAMSLLSNPKGLAVDTLGVDAVKNNGGTATMTNEEFSQKWLNKFGAPDGARLAVNTDMNSTDPILPPEALALRTFWFGADGEYSATSSIGNAKRRDLAANAIMQKAIQYRDERFLLAMPEELLTPELRAKYLQASETIGSMKVQDINDAETKRKLGEAQVVRDVTTAVINDRASGLQSDPYTYALSADGKTMDPVKLEAAQAAIAASGNFIGDVTSVSRAATVKQDLVNAFITNDFSKIPSLKAAGDTPTKDEVRQAIMMDPTMNAKEKLSLIENIEKDVFSPIQVLQDPTTEKYYSTYVSGTLEGMLRDPIMSLQLMKYPDIRTTVRDAFDLSIMSAIKSSGGIPMDQTKMLSDARAAAKSIIDGITGITPANAPPIPSPDGHFEDVNGVRTWVPNQ